MNLRNRLYNIIRKHSLLVQFSLVFCAFLIPRIFFYNYIPVPGIDDDSLTYWKVAFQAHSAEWPLFNIRTPLYPLFLFAISSISENLLVITIIQSLITLMTGIFIVYTFSLFYKNIAWYITIVVSVIIFSDLSLRYDSMLLPESLYTNSIVLFTATCIWAFKRNTIITWALLSAITGIIIILRPSGLFLIPLIALIGLYLLFNKYGMYRLLSLIMPLSIILTACCFYNHKTLGNFTISPWGGMNLVGTTFTYMQPSEEFPDSINTAIIKVTSNISNHDKVIVRNSWNPVLLMKAFEPHYYLNIPFTSELMAGDYHHNKIIKTINSVKDVTNHTIKESPFLYIKFFYASFLGHLGYLNGENYNFYSGIILDRKNRVEVYTKTTLDRGLVTDGPISNNVVKYAFKNYYPANPFNFETRYNQMIANPLFKAYDLLNFYSSKILKNNVLVILYLITLLAGLVVLIKQKFKDTDSIIVLIIGLTHILAIVLTSMVEVPLKRYVFPTEMSIYITICFIPVLFGSVKSIYLKRK